MNDPVKTLKKWAISRRQKTHKYEAGYVFILAGSEMYPGAAVLATRAAMRMGAGGVIVGTPSAVKPLVLNHVPEAIVLTIPDAPEALSIIKEALIKCKTMLIGPGLGRHQSAISLVHSLLDEVTLPMVIDADGLFALAQFDHKNLRDNQRLLTPHQGEFAWFQKEFLNQETLQAFAHQWKSEVLYKGFPGQVFSLSQPPYINTTGNTAATTAGCGDVLAGICASLLAQGLSSYEAATAGLYLAGMAADQALSNLHLPGLMASDIITYIPQALQASLNLTIEYK